MFCIVRYDYLEPQVTSPLSSFSVSSTSLVNLQREFRAGGVIFLPKCQIHVNVCNFFSKADFFKSKFIFGLYKTFLSITNVQKTFNLLKKTRRFRFDRYSTLTFQSPITIFSLKHQRFSSIWQHILRITFFMVNIFLFFGHYNQRLRT